MRELIFGFLYDTKTKILLVNRIVSLVSALTAFFLLVYELGFPISIGLNNKLRVLIDVLFGLFALTYFIRVLYSLNIWEYIKSTWIEFLFMCSIVITGINRFFFDVQIIVSLFTWLGFAKYGRLYTLVISAFLLYLVLLEFVKLSSLLNRAVLKPATTFILSFVVLIAIGSSLLMLPEMTVEKGIAPYEALFTSVSASCVTGLSVVNISEFYSRKGQVVIMLLMQLGGIGIVSFTTFFATFLKRGVGFRHQRIIQDFLNTDSLYNAKGLLRQVVFITLFIEIGASVLIFFSWGDQVEFTTFWHKVFYSLFHGISAFCNGGFSLFTDGLYESPIRFSYLLHVVIGLTIFMGSVGFSSIQDVFSIKNLRHRLENPWVDWKLSTRISVYMSLFLLLLGMILFTITEYYNTLSGKSTFEVLVLSFFQSVTTRTAGFNTLPTSAFSNATLLFMTFLMFIGASSGSTGGGIKTSTFLLILTFSWRTIQGQNKINIGSRSIGPVLIAKASAIFVFAVAFNVLMVFILTITDYKISVINLLFEQISAFTTTGLSTGITTDLSMVGQSILMLSMFVGRIGSLTLLLALSNKTGKTNYAYPKAHLFIG